jgi:hypothetical protein
MVLLADTWRPEVDADNMLESVAYHAMAAYGVWHITGAQRNSFIRGAFFQPRCLHRPESYSEKHESDGRF